MRSYFVPATMALFGAMLVSTMAAESSSTQRREMFDTVDAMIGDYFEPIRLNKPQTRSGLIVQSAENQGDALSGAVGKTDTLRSRLRGKSDGKGKGLKSAKSKKGYFGKDCPKKYKSKGKGDKSKGKGKGKGKGTGVPTYSPTESPSESPSVSEQPSNSPSVSLEPSWEWCNEDNWPTWSPAPTVTADPTTSAQKTVLPTATFAPTVTGEPTETPPPPGVPGSGADAGAFCQNFDADVTSEGIVLVSSSNNPPAGFEKDSVAALTKAVVSPVPLTDTTNYKTTIKFDVSDSSVSPSTVAAQMDETVSPPTSLELVGCPRKARDVAMAYFLDNSERRLQLKTDDSTLANIQNFQCGGVSAASISCETIINYQGDESRDTLYTRLVAALAEYMSMLDNLEASKDWYPQQNITKGDVTFEQTTDTNIGNIIEGNESRQGARAGPFIGAATGMLAVLLLLVLLVRRRNRYDEEQVSHLKLDDEDDTDYYGSESDSPVRNEYNTRDTHIVGEGDSVISHWTGYTGRSGQPEHDAYADYTANYDRDGLLRPRSDVHQCSSATCEKCDANRQAGVNFIKTGAAASLPSRTHSLPSDASREYIAEDTVML